MADKGTETVKKKTAGEDTAPITSVNQRGAIDITVLSEVKNFDKLSKLEKRTKINELQHISDILLYIF